MWFVIAVPEEGVGWSGSATTGNSVTRSSKGSVEHEDVAPHRRVCLDALASKSEQLLSEHNGAAWISLPTFGLYLRIRCPTNRWHLLHISLVEHA